MDKIIIKDLAVHYRVGVPDQERSQPQRLLLTVEMLHDFAAAVAGDDLNHSIDYDALSRRLLEFGNDRSWRLIESVAVHIAEMILEEFRPEGVFVEVKKFVIPEAKYVSVTVVRGMASEGDGGGR
jgi:dihydroneopterin aldolase